MAQRAHADAASGRGPLEWVARAMALLKGILGETLEGHLGAQLRGQWDVGWSLVGLGF